jgi:hypothetical protein
MKKNVVTIPLGQKHVSEIVRIEGDDSPGPDDGTSGFRALWDFVTSIHTNPTLLRHSVECPTEFVVRHNGRAWTAESRATVEVKEGS